MQNFKSQEIETLYLMHAFDLLKMANDLEIPNFIGVFPLDKLPKSLRAPSNFIVNTHTNNLPGEHWLAISYRGRSNGCYVFDSFGRYYPNMLRTYLHKHCSSSGDVHYNSIQFQDYWERTCGHFCIAWLIYINGGGENFVH